MSELNQPITEADLDEIERYVEAATPGPWWGPALQQPWVDSAAYAGSVIAPDGSTVLKHRNWKELCLNLRFAIRARTDLPRLVKDLRERIQTERIQRDTRVASSPSVDKAVSDTWDKAIRIVKNPRLKNGFWDKREDEVAESIQQRMAIALECASRGEDYRSSLEAARKVFSREGESMSIPRQPIKFEEVDALHDQAKQIKRLLLRILRKIEKPDYHRRWLRRHGRY